MNVNEIKNKKNNLKNKNSNININSRNKNPNFNDKYNPYSVYWPNEFLKKYNYCIGINYNSRVFKPNLRVFVKPKKTLRKSKSTTKILLNNNVYKIYI